MDKIKLTNRCPIRTSLELLGGKWKLLILFQLRLKPSRLSELKKMIPDISEKMLIQELRILEENNLVSRKNYGEVPPRVEYKITTSGKKAIPLIEVMEKFAKQYEKLNKT